MSFKNWLHFPLQEKYYQPIFNFSQQVAQLAAPSTPRQLCSRRILWASIFTPSCCFSLIRHFRWHKPTTCQPLAFDRFPFHRFTLHAITSCSALSSSLAALSLFFNPKIFLHLHRSPQIFLLCITRLRSSASALEYQICSSALNTISQLLGIFSATPHSSLLLSLHRFLGLRSRLHSTSALPSTSSLSLRDKHYMCHPISFTLPLKLKNQTSLPPPHTHWTPYLCALI